MYHDAALPASVPCVLVALVLATGFRVGPVGAQQRDTYAFRLQARGMEVVNGGLAAMGGRDVIERAGAARMGAHLTVYPLGQGLRADEPSEPEAPTYMTLTYDYHAQTALYEMFPSDTSNQSAAYLVLSPADTFFYMREQNLLEEILEPDALQVILRALHYPPAFLLEATERAGTVRWLGRSEGADAAFDVVTYVDALGQQIALYIDTRTRLLARVEIVEAHPQFGDHAVVTTFTDYRAAGPLTLPYRVQSATAGLPLTEAVLAEIALGATVEETVLHRPAEAVLGPPVTGNHPAPDLAATELARGVYAIFNATGGYNVMFVDLGESVFVIEPVISPEVTRAVVDVIHTTLPGKPIGHVVMTHHHFDHSGGLVEYLVQGVTVVANPGDVGFIHDIAAAPRTLESDCGAVGTPTVEVVDGKRTYGSGASTVELYQVGPNPHAEQLLIAYLPSLRLMYVADVFNVLGPATVGEGTLALADAIEALGLELERVIPTHGTEATGEQFWETVRGGREGGRR